MPTPSPVSSHDIARLVTEVLRRIHAETESPQTQKSQSTSPQATTTVSDRVIAAETIIKLAPGTRVAYVKHVLEISTIYAHVMEPKYIACDHQMHA